MNDRVIKLIPAKTKAGPTENRPFRVAAYCRVSSTSEEQELSLETQKWYYSNKIENIPSGKVQESLRILLQAET